MDDEAEHEHDRTAQDRHGEGAKFATQQGLDAECRGQIQSEIHADHQELALGEVDDPHDAEDQTKADAHQRIDAADQQPGDERLQHILDDARGIHHAPIVSLPFFCTVVPPSEGFFCSHARAGQAEGSTD